MAVVAVDGALNFELAVPGQVFGSANLVASAPLYEVVICGGRPSASVSTATAFGGPRIAPAESLEGAAAADVVVVPGDERTIFGTDFQADCDLLEALRAAHRRGARLVSLCVGAFTLAAAGLLDDRRATTHWAYADELSRRHPSVNVDRNALYVEDGTVFTSAGVTASIDLCLHLLRLDHGDAVASAAARHLVMPAHRLGGQAQYVQRETLLGGAGTLAPTLRWLEANLDRPISLADIAGHSHVSARSVSRQFRDQTGVAPLQWLLDARVEKAKNLLAESDHTIEEIARRCGFGSGASFRRHFGRVAGVSPRLYRHSFGRLARIG